MNTLVFLHGWGTSGNIWRRQEETFSAQGFTVLTPTFPLWEVSWLTRYLQELPLTNTILVGWSLGGMLLLEALTGEFLQPAGLALVATPVSFCQRPDHPFGQPLSVVRALRRIVSVDSKRGLADFATRCLAAGEKTFQEELLQYFQPWANGADLVAGLNYLISADLRRQLSPIQTKVLIIQGETDNIVPLAQSDFLRQHLKGSQTVILPEAGHVPFLTQADKFNRVLEDFI